MTCFCIKHGGLLDIYIYIYILEILYIRKTYRKHKFDRQLEQRNVLYMQDSNAEM